jgi:23S rRNA A1618 N6-methylase RlmF
MNWLTADLNLSAPGSATYLVHVDTLQSTSHKTQMLDSHFPLSQGIGGSCDFPYVILCPAAHLKVSSLKVTS